MLSLITHEKKFHLCFQADKIQMGYDKAAGSIVCHLLICIVKAVSLISVPLYFSEGKFAILIVYVFVSFVYISIHTTVHAAS